MNEETLRQLRERNRLRLRERNWLREENPRVLLESAPVSERKLRLVAVACCRRRYRPPIGKGKKHIVHIVEDYADQRASWEEVCAAADNVRDNLMLDHLAHPSAATAARLVVDDCLEQHPNSKNHIVGLIREIVGNPFCLTTVDPSWLTWNDRKIPKIAEEIYEKKAFDTLPVLADALEDAGCTDPEILNHCRGPGPHVRGCWVIDLLLGKE